MAKFEALIKFRSAEDRQSYFAPIETNSKSGIVEPLSIGTVVAAYSSIEDVQTGAATGKHTIAKLLAPLPSTEVPIYCVGLNYRSHAAEAKLTVPKYPPLWTKPAASLADPDEAITVNEFCATSLLDFEGELVFVTSRECKNITPAEADNNILGYTVGNDLSCRFFQLPNNSGGQFFYAKAFDKFAPIGPVLVSADTYAKTAAGRRLRTKVNGKVVQDVELATDMMFTPAQVLNHMSQGTTIPAGTAVVTGTAAGVGAFQSPKSFLGNGDVVEVSADGLGSLRNTMKFAKLAWWRSIWLKVLGVGLYLFT
ncbi:uncharacterized protein RHO25_010203 [Cercospora beticola]|uniref:Fumarylacetoacetase-like C-terminal domain-containing protein n=2 Tax=Cercospora beticola TaxID=122368 RepID=A0ABZ0P1N3_CERBT|nr:hypothetical protein RHO25_010203 [Cercospora beticola]